MAKGHHTKVGKPILFSSFGLHTNDHGKEPLVSSLVTVEQIVQAIIQIQI